MMRVGDAADQLVHPAAEEAARRGRRSRPTANDERDRGAGDAEVEPRRHEDAGEDVAAELVGAEPVLRARRLQRARRCCWPAGRRARGSARGSRPATKKTNRPSAKPVTGFSAHHMPRMPPGGCCAPAGRRAHARRARGSSDPVHHVDGQVQQHVEDRHGAARSPAPARSPRRSAPPPHRSRCRARRRPSPPARWRRAGRRRPCRAWSPPAAARCAAHRSG